MATVGVGTTSLSVVDSCTLTDVTTVASVVAISLGGVSVASCVLVVLSDNSCVRSRAETSGESCVATATC